MTRILAGFTLAFIVLTLGFSAPSSAHDLGLAQVTVSSGPEGSITLRAKLSATREAVAPQITGDCKATSQMRAAPDKLNQVIETQVVCPPGGDFEQILLPWKVNGVFLISQIAGQEGDARFVPVGTDGTILNVGDLSFQDRGTFDIASLYVQLGIKHILIGLDHLALILCLAMLAKGMVLVRLITAFTIGHSITLCLAALQIVQVPVAPVEVLIVLSVAYLARDVWLGRSLNRNSTVLMVGIGLLHGLGFASVLSEIGLPQSDLLLALLSFNIGIEIGQLVFLSGVILLFSLFRWIAPISLIKPVPYLASFVVGSMAMYGTFERIAGFYA